MIIQVEAGLRINASDGLNFTVQKRIGATVPEKWANVAYYSNLPDALKSLFLKEYVQSVEVTADIKTFLAHMESKLEKMQTVCNGVVTRVSAANVNKYISFEDE